MGEGRGMLTSTMQHSGDTMTRTASGWIMSRSRKWWENRWELPAHCRHVQIWHKNLCLCSTYVNYHRTLVKAVGDFFNDFWAFLGLFFWLIRWIWHLARMTITSVTFRWLEMVHYPLLLNWLKWYSTQVILSFSLHLIFGLIGSYLIWRLYSILEGHLPSYRYLVLWTLL